MTPEEKLALDVKDFWRIYHGLETYFKLDAKGYMERFKAHPEDAFCTIADYSGSGTQQCTRDAWEAIADLAERHRDSLPIPDDYSVEDIRKGIQATFIKALVDEKYDELALPRIFNETLALAEKNHIERRYHFPCVVAHTSKAVQFHIPSVAFSSSAVIPESLAKELDRYGDDTEHLRMVASDFQKSCQQYGWLASVTIPPCSEESAKRRAEVAVSTAINLLRLVFGIPHGRDMRLAHTALAGPTKTQYAVFKNGRLDISWSRTYSGANVPDDWCIQMESASWKPFWIYASRLLRTTIDGRRSEIAERVVDALTWYGEAAFETAPGTKVVNFVAALEHLTTTEKFGTHLFCSRVAMLAFHKSNDFEKTYWKAFEVYSARSAVMHGWYSPSNQKFRKTLSFAYELARDSLFSAIEIHARLAMDTGEPPTIKPLRNFFTSQQSSRAKELVRLRKEVQQKEKELKRRFAL